MFHDQIRNSVEDHRPGGIEEYFGCVLVKHAGMNTEIKYISVNQKLPDDTFSYVPPEGVLVRDATANILKQKVNNK